MDELTSKELELRRKNDEIDSKAKDYNGIAGSNELGDPKGDGAIVDQVRPKKDEA